MIDNDSGDPLRSVREHMVANLRPLVFDALGVSKEDVGEETVTKTYPLPDGTTIECSAVNFGGILVSSIKYTGVPVFVTPDLAIAYTVKHELIGDSDISKEKLYQAFNSQGEPVDQEVLEAIFGEPMGDMHSHSDELGIFDDHQFLSEVLSSLNTEK